MKLALFSFFIIFNVFALNSEVNESDNIDELLQADIYNSPYSDSEDYRSIRYPVIAFTTAGGAYINLSNKVQARELFDKLSKALLSQANSVGGRDSIVPSSVLDYARQGQKLEELKRLLSLEIDSQDSHKFNLLHERIGQQSKIVDKMFKKAVLDATKALPKRTTTISKKLKISSAGIAIVALGTYMFSEEVIYEVLDVERVGYRKFNGSSIVDIFNEIDELIRE